MKRKGKKKKAKVTGVSREGLMITSWPDICCDEKQ